MPIWSYIRLNYNHINSWTAYTAFQMQIKMRRFFTLIFFCLGRANIILSNADLKNVAYAKSVTLSSEYNTDRTWVKSSQRSSLWLCSHSTWKNSVAENRSWSKLPDSWNWSIRQIWLLWYVIFSMQLIVCLTMKFLN